MKTLCKTLYGSIYLTWLINQRFAWNCLFQWSRQTEQWTSGQMGELFKLPQQRLAWRPGLKHIFLFVETSQNASRDNKLPTLWEDDSSILIPQICQWIGCPCLAVNCGCRSLLLILIRCNGLRCFVCARWWQITASTLWICTMRCVVRRVTVRRTASTGTESYTEPLATCCCGTSVTPGMWNCRHQTLRITRHYAAIMMVNHESTCRGCLTSTSVSLHHSDAMATAAATTRIATHANAMWIFPPIILMNFVLAVYLRFSSWAVLFASLPVT